MMRKVSPNSIIDKQEQMLIETKGTPHKLYRIAFEILMNGNPRYFHPFTINPEELTREDVAQVSVTPTLGGMHVDDFGTGLITYNLQGTTGFHTRTNSEGVVVDGLTEFKNLRDNVYRYFLEPNGSRKERLTDSYTLIFHDWEMDEHYEVQPSGGFKLARSKSRPTLYAYDFSFVVIKPTTFRSTYRDYVNLGSTRTRLSSAHNTLVTGTNLLRILTAFVPRR